MTYFELINYLHQEKENSRNEEIFKVLDQDFKYEGNIRIRYSNHVVKLISDRLNRVINNFVTKLQAFRINEETMPLEINEIKQEINYCFRLSQTKPVEGIKEELHKSLKSFVENAESHFKNSFKDSQSPKIYSLIQNINLMEGI